MKTEVDQNKDLQVVLSTNCIDTGTGTMTPMSSEYSEISLLKNNVFNI